MLKCHYVEGPDVQNVEIQWNPINATTAIVILMDGHIKGVQSLNTKTTD